MKKIRLLSFKEKIMLANILVFTVILCLLSLGFSLYWYKVESEKNLSNLRTVAQAKASVINDKLYTMDRIALQLASNETIIDLFSTLPPSGSDYNYFLQNPFANVDLSTFTASFVLKKDSLSRLCIFNDSNDFFFIGEMMDFAKTADYIHGFSFQSILTEFENRKVKVFIPPRPDPFLYGNRNAQEMISVVREIKNLILMNSHTVGYVEAQLNSKIIDDLLEDLGPDFSFSLIDEKGYTLYEFQKKENPIVRRNSIIRVPIHEFNLILMVSVENPGLIRSFNLFLTILISVLVLMILSIISSEFLIIKKLTEPLDALIQKVGEVDIQKLELDLLPDHDIDEIQQLNLAFNQMLNKVDNSIEELIHARTGELKSHILALQAQMNPHFIHNILTVISSLAAEYDADDIEKICLKLSQIIKFAGSYEDSSIPMVDEITHCRNYLELMKIRYEERIDYHFTFEGDNTAIFIPKLIIQPLVENCFKYAFRKKTSLWKIHICCRTSNESWSVEIIDNGRGFDPDYLDSFSVYKSELSGIAGEDMVSSLSIGGLTIKNILIRLFLLYKEKMIFDLSNIESGGARILIGGKLSV